MWVYYLSDLHLESLKNLPQSLQEVLLMWNVRSSGMRTEELEWAVLGSQYIKDTKPEQLLGQSEQD